MTSRPKMVGLTLSIPAKAKETIDRQARERGLSSSMWAAQVWDVGFAAICAREKSMPITDADLDAIVGATLLLWKGEHWKVPEIAKGLGVPEATIRKILDGWRQYRRAMGGKT